MENTRSPQADETFLYQSTVLTITNCPCTLTQTKTGIPPPSAKPYTTTVNEVVTAYTTVCPHATTFTEKTETYTATEGETVTVTNCPCSSVKTTVFTPGVPATTTGVTVLTTTVPTYTTVCPSSTTIVVPGPSSTVTYTATPSQTVTVTNGPFTTTTAKPYTSVFTPPPAPVTPTPAPAPAPTGSPVKPSAAPVPFTGGAQKIASGLSLGGVLALAAYFL